MTRTVLITAAASERSPRAFNRRALLTRALRVLILLGAGVLSHVSSAAEAYHSSVIRGVYPMSNGSFVLLFDTDAGSSCTNANTPRKYYYVVVGENGVTSEGIKSLLATSLTAAAQAKTVLVAFDNATNFCYVNRLIVSF